MSATSPHLGLILTNATEGATKVSDWINGLTGQSSSSNMSKIDEAYGELNTTTNKHISDSAVHVSQGDKETWNKKTDLVRGYYNGQDFYKENTYENIITPSSQSLYLDFITGFFYFWDEETQAFVNSSFPENTDFDFGTWG